ncbi:unnamed protein product (macronuclear) [Paramecium tetraurelia]|uniref:RING-type domain-containing protein n=1 Tax=Paramecium tetraurelia TaxID=5888 RepID=A0CHG4_PARTE|nr:uncharacterized protein GSPATT00038333001 [Paramecium tetraurelia]CAK70231.1 unnamed protein product [Paramecium tetraurelia]|eukprot:XP_001437628.1 hypothetical protein (macronuclear) [Paramecium tetraurelia strain d4-2]
MIQIEQQENIRQKKKVRNLIETLENHLRLDEKITNLKIQLEKMRLQITTSTDKNSIKEKISQLEVAMFNYEEEKKISNYTDEERSKLLDNIRNIILQIRPLPFSCDNKRQIHKNLKNLNRFEEHFLILRVKSNNEKFVIEASKILSLVCDKKREIKKVIDQSKENSNNDESQYGNILENQAEIKIVDENQKVHQQETPTLGGNIIEQINLDSQNKLLDENMIKQEPIEIGQENEQICESEKCQICFAKKRKFVAIPCGHFIYCQVCKELVMQKLKCLLCRQNVLQMFEIFA